jgi:two-component system response regulator NreC
MAPYLFRLMHWNFELIHARNFLPPAKFPKISFRWGIFMPIDVIVADDHQIILDSLTRFIGEEPDLKIISTVRDGLALIDAAMELRPDVAVVDISLPGMNGIDATNRMLTNNPELKVIALSMHNDMKSLVNMLRAGAKAYISKQSASWELIRAIRAVVAGNYYLCPEMTTSLLEVFLNSMSEKEFAQAPALTAREREVLRLLAGGAAIKEIAYQLDLSPKTVDTHRYNIMRKLDVSSVAELIKYALREGLTTP